jgi:hypothetical protein
MSTIFETAASVARDAVPKVLCGAGGLSRLGQDIAGKINPFYSGSLLDRYQTAVTGALQGFCPVPPTGPVPEPSSPFEGGQCLTYYHITVDVTWYSQGDPNPKLLTNVSVYNQWGPVQSINLSDPFEITGSGVSTVYRRVYVTSGGFDTTLWNFSGLNGAVSYSNVRITRTDGQPDDCGNPPPVFPPGTPTPNPPTPPGVDIEIDLPDIGPVIVGFTPIVGIVYVDANAEFNVPVTVNVDVGGLDINFDLDFDINLSDPTAPPKPKPPDRPKNPDDRVDPPDCPPPADCRNEPDEDPPSVAPPTEDPKEFVVTGAVALCVVDVLNCSCTEILQENGPNIWAPRLGYIRFQYVTNTGETVWGTDIAVKGTNFATNAPDMGIKCVGAVLNTERGVAGELFLLRKKRTAGCC